MIVRNADRRWALARHLRAENNHDLDAIMETFSPDAVFGVNGTTFEGREVIHRQHALMGFGDEGAFRKLHVAEHRRYVTVDAIVLELTLQGTHSGTWEGLKPTGATFSLPVCTVYRFDADGKLRSEMLYFDSDALRRQLNRPRVATA
jgi:steroid delta-isomerase-like uncharacterized protein